MRFLCDANVGSTLARSLVEDGHDVVRATLVLRDADDRTILAHAVAENRILVTCDSDFGELIFLHGLSPPPAILYVRFEPADVADIIPRLLACLDFAVLNGHITVIGAEHDRRTPFPVRSRNHG